LQQDERREACCETGDELLESAGLALKGAWAEVGAGARSGVVIGAGSGTAVSAVICVGAGSIVVRAEVVVNRAWSW
jgi:hypothetical protein